MKILCLADLHLFFLGNHEKTEKFMKSIKKIIDAETPDCIAIAGDIWEYTLLNTDENPYMWLRYVLQTEIPAVCVLGNHEFAYSSVENTLNKFSSFQDRCGIHILDIENSWKTENINFIGNVFWYDNSLGDHPLSVKDYILPEWLDSTISGFIPSEENRKCRMQILENIIHDKKTVNILITHTCPHRKLNWFSNEEPMSRYNQYSGNDDFLKELTDVNYAICGHTHKKTEAEIYDISCFNIGNEYWCPEKNRISYKIIETA